MRENRGVLVAFAVLLIAAAIVAAWPIEPVQPTEPPRPRVSVVLKPAERPVVEMEPVVFEHVVANR